MKIASRYLLPLELYLSVVMISWGISGTFGNGHLYRLVNAESDPIAWGLTFCGVGLLQLVSAANELLWGRHWSVPMLLGSVSLRCIAAFLSIGVWVYACYLFAYVETPTPVGSLLILAPVTFAFELWIYAGNLRVRCVLNPKISTTRLQAMILADRRRSIGEGL